MKTLRLRAILKQLGYTKRTVLLNDVLYENKSGDLVYFRLEQDTYQYLLKNKGKKYASKKLFKYLNKKAY